MITNKFIVINQMPSLTKHYSKVALGKARYDINTIAEKNGYSIKNIICKFFKIPFLTTLNVLRQYVSLLTEIGGRNELVIQYPVSCPKAFPLAIKMMHLTNNRITLLIHDINSFRYERNSSKEVSILNSVDYLIVHTKAMEDLLKSNGVHTKMAVLHLFDYLSSDNFMSIGNMLTHKKEVIFAGNLAKSDFIPALCNYNFKDITFDLYGFKKEGIDFNGYKNIKYEGVFDSNHTAQIIGGWGLVWDGDSIDTCSGSLGNYLRYNLPHKLSLYLAAGIPVIVWKGSAVAEYVENKEIGFSIESLKEIPMVINSIPDTKYMQFVHNCHEIGLKLRQGRMFLEAIKQVQTR